MIDARQMQLYIELVRRKAELPPEKQALVTELGKRFAAEMGGNPTGKAAEAPGLLSPLIGAAKTGAGVVKDVATGAGQEFASTLMNLGNLVRKVPVIGPALDRGPSIDVPEDLLQPKNTAQSVGRGAAQIGEFYAGGRALEPLKAAAQAKTGSALLRTIIGATSEGAAAAGVTAAQQGSTENLIAPAVTAATLSAALPFALKGARMLGEKIEKVAVKAVDANIKDGFKVSNIFKYKLGGTLEQTLTKTEKLLGEMRTMAERLRAGGSDVDLVGVLGKVDAQLAKDAAKNQGTNSAITNALKREFDEIAMLVTTGHVNGSGMANVPTAHDILKAVGERGAWSYGMRDAESVATEKVANAFYAELRKAIEAAVPDGSALQKVNRAMMELVPIKMAVLRRIPVAERNAAISLPEVVALANGSIPLGIASRLGANPRMANMLVRGTEMLPQGAPAVGARVGAAAVSGATK